MSYKVKKITHLISLQHFMKFHINDIGYFELKARYEALLNKEFGIGMFVPCDLEGNVLMPPYPIKQIDPKKWSLRVYDKSELNLYNQAKERILFEDWTYDFEDEYLIFKKGDKTDEFFLDFEEIEGLKLIDLVDESFPFSQIALNQIYNNYETD